jgi:hypothetical protein
MELGDALLVFGERRKIANVSIDHEMCKGVLLIDVQEDPKGFLVEEEGMEVRQDYIPIKRIFSIMANFQNVSIIILLSLLVTRQIWRKSWIILQAFFIESQGYIASITEKTPNAKCFMAVIYYETSRLIKTKSTQIILFNRHITINIIGDIIFSFYIG